MIENISSDIVNRLLRNNIIETEKSEMYQYGFEIFFNIRRAMLAHADFSIFKINDPEVC